MNTFRLFLLSPSGVVLLRWTALLVFAWVVNGLLRWSHPRWRLILWRSVLVIGCLLPLGMLFPSWSFQIPIKTRFPNTAILSAVSPSDAVPTPWYEVVPAAAKLARAVGLRSSTVNHWAGRLLKESSITRILLLIWGLGGTVGAIRLLRIHLRLAGLRKNAVNPSIDLLAKAGEIQNRLGVRRSVAILVSEEVTSPFVCGLWHPTMLLPEVLLRTLQPAEIPALLSHEMAHLRSHDLAWCVGWRWMKTLVWFHPLVWTIPAAHNLACEQEADRLASNQWDSRSSYTQLLAQLALRVFALSSVETALTLNGGSQIAQRLTFLGRKDLRSWRRLNSVTGVGLVAALTLVAAGWGFSSAKAADAAATVQSGDLSSPSAQGNKVVAEKQAATVELKHYENTEWHFAMDIPKSWNVFPPVSSNSPYEVIRFESRENGMHNLIIIFRNPSDPGESREKVAEKTQQVLARGGFGNFVIGQTTIDSKVAATLDFDKTKDNATWSCREYFLAKGTLGYVLGLGSDHRAEMIDLDDRIAKTFRILE